MGIKLKAGVRDPTSFNGLRAFRKFGGLVVHLSDPCTRALYLYTYIIYKYICIHMGVSKIGGPQNGWFFMENPI